MDSQEVVTRARKVLEIEAEAIRDLLKRVDRSFVQAVDLLYSCQGKVIVTGMGKSGLIGKKIAATLSSTGTPTFYLHPAEGRHGDLGMVSRKDVMVILSNSGETEEIIDLLTPLKRFNIPLICLTGKPHSTLAKRSHIVIDVSVKEEACPMNLAPTASTTATLAMGDALAITLLTKRGFKSEDFAIFHPAGNIGRKLLLKVEDVMHTGNQIPAVTEDTTMKEALMEITSKKLGMTTVTDHKGKLKGIITDGDLRRWLERVREGKELFDKMAGEVMTPHPKTIQREAMAARAVHEMEKYSITTLVILGPDQDVAGVIHLHDLLKQGIV